MRSNSRKLILILAVMYILGGSVGLSHFASAEVDEMGEEITPESQSDKGESAFFGILKIFGPIILILAIVGVFGTRALTKAGQARYLDHHYVHEVMSKDFFSIDEDKSLLETHWIFDKKNLSDIITVREPMILTGVVFRKDVDALDPAVLSEKKAKDIAKPPVATLAPHDTVAKALELFTKNRVAYIPVLESGRVVAIVILSTLEKVIREYAPKP